MTLFSKNIVNLSNSDRTGVYHSLYSISPKDSSVSVTGIVIKVQDPRCTSKDRTNRSYTSILTIRDSVQDFVNVTLYGSLKYFKMAFELICVGNTVQFSNLSVNEKNRDKENYKPWTPVNYYLFGSEEKCTFRKTQSFGESWQLLINYLTKPLIHYKNLGLVDTKQNQIISMIGILTRLGKPKIVFSTYESLSYKTCIEIYDENGNSKLITLWGKSYAKLSEFWMCKQTVLCLNDIKMTFDERNNISYAYTISKTLIIVNPYCNISNKLREYIDKISLIEIPHEKFVESIKKTYNLKEIKMMLSRQEVDKFGLTFVNLTGFDIDVETPNFIKIKCSMCKYEVINGHCSLSCNMEDNRDTVKTFMLPISISDETGSFTNGVFLSDYIMLNILKCQAKDFEGLKNTIKTKIKWKYLFERCKLYFKIIQTQNQVKLKVLEFELDE